MGVVLNDGEWVKYGEGGERDDGRPVEGGANGIRDPCQQRSLRASHSDLLSFRVGYKYASFLFRTHLYSTSSVTKQSLVLHLSHTLLLLVAYQPSLQGQHPQPLLLQRRSGQ